MRFIYSRKGGIQPSRSSLGRCRAGVTFSLEMVLILPILVLVLLALTEFGMHLLVSQQLHSISGETARYAASPAATKTSIESFAERQLANYSWGNRVDLELNASTLQNQQLSWEDLETGDFVTVKMSLPVTVAVPDFLAIIGYSYQGESFTARHLAQRQ
ncbi:MAG: pilus assembly protein [Pirellulaceae bacterium]|nr:pilus assembly protein [Pirellulaceae bacterium]